VCVDKANTNDDSMQKLNGILTTVKSFNQYPPAIRIELPFYLKGTTDNELKKIELNLITTGGDCRHQLASSFEKFFIKAGIHNGKFIWGDEYFPSIENKNKL
jgi:hypothetical protein